MSLKGVMYGQPWAKKRPRISAPRAGARPRTHQDPADAAAEKQTREFLTEWLHGTSRRGKPFVTNVYLHLWFHRESRQVVDLDNLIKHFCDAANGVLWVDDCQITAITGRLALDRERPRTLFIVGLDPDSNMARDLSHKLPE